MDNQVDVILQVAAEQMKRAAIQQKLRAHVEATT
jgi:hypothetical protein